MSTKDMRFRRDCPICGDNLPGSDDGLEVFESLVAQVANPELKDMGCTLCGEPVTRETAAEIIARGEPPLLDARTGKVTTL